MKMTTKFISAVLAFALIGGAAVIPGSFVPSAYAQSSAKTTIDQAKNDGLVGERIDGYLGLVSASAPADVQAAMNEINIRRKSLYTKLARAQNVSIEVVAALSGEKLTSKAKPGQKIMLADGVWQTAG